MLLKNYKLMNPLIQDSKRITKAYIPILIILLLIIYFRSINFNIIFFDDDSLIDFIDSGLPFYKKITTAFTSNYLGGQYYRPLTITTLILDFEFRNNLFSIFHLSNFLIHLSVSVLLFFVIKKFGYTAHIAFISALIFSINPVHVNAVGWIAGRGDILSALFSMLGLYSFQRYQSSPKPFLITFATLLTLLAILSKETAIAFPFLLLLIPFIYKHKYEIDKNVFSVLLMFIIVTGSYFIIRFILSSDLHINKFVFSELTKNIFLIPEIISKFFIPSAIKPLAAKSAITSIFGTVILSIIIFIPFFINKIDKPRYYFGFFWFILLMIPSMPFRTMQQDGSFYWDCRSYLPLIGITLILAEISRVISANTYRKFFLTLLITYCVLLVYYTISKISYYKNAETYWTEVKSDYPHSYLPNIALFNYYESVNNSGYAERELLTGIKIRPEELILRRLLVDYYLRKNDKLKAFYEIKNALNFIQPESEYFLNNYISLSLTLNKPNEIDSLFNMFKGKEDVLKKIKVLTEQKHAEYLMEKVNQNNED